MDRLTAGVHDEYKSEALERSSRLAGRVDGTVQTLLTEHAQAAARRRDDNHVGTEHLILGLFLHGANRARDLLESHGISQQVFESVLDDEPGPSPNGVIPYTVRSMMIGGLALAAAEQRGSNEVTDVDILLGAIAESGRWERQHAWGPHHLRAAADKASTSLDELQQAALAVTARA